MPERANLLHNMSAPPKSVVKYSGLADLGTTSSPDGSRVRFTCKRRSNNPSLTRPDNLVAPE